MLFVVLNQIAYTVVVRLASSGTAQGATGGDAGTGYTVYSNTFLLVMVPHSIVTVSLATAILPLLSARASDGDLAGLAHTLASTLRTALALVVPFAQLLTRIAMDLSSLVWGYGAASASYQRFAPSLALFGAGVMFFTVHYLMLRGFYALERTRTVFWVQCGIAGVNIALALLFVHVTDAEHTSPALVLAYTGSYAVGAAGSYAVLRRLLGGLETPLLVRFLVRIVVAATLAALAAGVATWLLGELLGEDRGKPASMLVLAVVPTVYAAAFLPLARAMRIGEVTELVDTVARRLPIPSRG